MEQLKNPSEALADLSEIAASKLFDPTETFTNLNRNEKNPPACIPPYMPPIVVLKPVLKILPAENVYPILRHG